jgi:hypothetical protein
MGRQGRGGQTAGMLTVLACVRNGRLIVDEPTDLPEGTEIGLAASEDEPWDLAAEQRAD